ncbi:hypothetical protein OG738_36375 [Amycolatopsis sp. NBC_01488]|uniref:hypothetical protein n=1 Tax=Amycolatopsis sp. NBC_01488 TaxID=2903563 RepID=UPI002E2DB13F|nr:hypothetical protein [Amycolatopsis sp. NBC_01488]
MLRGGREAEAVQDEVAEAGERVARGKSGALQQRAGLDRVDGDGDDLGGEVPVDIAEGAGPDAFVDHLVDPAGGDVGVLAVDPGRRCVADHVVVERGAVQAHRGADAREVGPDALTGVGLFRDGLLEP